MFLKEDQRICSWTFKNVCTVAVYCWYIKDTFVGFCQQTFGKKNSDGILVKTSKKLLSLLVDFGHFGHPLCGRGGLGEFAKKPKFVTKNLPK